VLYKKAQNSGLFFFSNRENDLHIMMSESYQQLKDLVWAKSFNIIRCSVAKEDTYKQLAKNKMLYLG
jgi:hypothetical protein